MNKILMVEEEINTVKQMHEHLSLAGFEMFTAYDGLHGFQMAKDKVPDLIITDAVVPGMSGFELCKAIKHEEAIKSIPIVVMTEKHRLEDSFMFLGINDFLNKPFSMDELESVVRKRLDISQFMHQQKTKILVSGRPEVISCSQELLKKSPEWSAYFSYNSDSLLKDAITHAPDVIFMDLLMPGVGADEIIKKFKITPELKNAVILTYYASTSTSRDPFAVQAQMIEVQYMKRLTQEAGAKEYVGPFNPVTFFNLINVYRKGLEA